MNLKTLINKTADTVKFIMTQPTMIFRNKEDVILLNRAHVVDADESGRPDLIALQYYGDQSKLDMILKWNGISNPFSINEGDILEIPSPNTNFFKLERPREFENNPVKQQFVDGKRLGKKDQRRLDALKKKYGKENLLPPNVIPVGKKNYEFVGTRIRMGAQVQTDAVVNAINRNLGTDEGGDLSNLDLALVEIGGENTGAAFEKIPGGVWLWTGSDWIGVNPDIAQEVAGSLYDNFVNPNGNIEGSFEGQLYFNIIRDVATGDSIKADEDRLNRGQGNTNATGPVNTSETSTQGADTVGTNQDDGGNPVGGSNTNTNTNTSANNDTAGITPGGY